MYRFATLLLRSTDWHVDRALDWGRGVTGLRLASRRVTVSLIKTLYTARTGSTQEDRNIKVT